MDPTKSSSDSQPLHQPLQPAQPPPSVYPAPHPQFPPAQQQQHQQAYPNLGPSHYQTGPYQQQGFVQYGAVNAYYRQYTEPCSDAKMTSVNRHLFFWAWLPLATATLSLWVLGLWFLWLGPLIVTVLAAALGGAAVGPKQPKWGVIVAWVVMMILYTASIGWQLTVGFLSLGGGGRVSGVCLPSYFSASCRTSSDCSSYYNCYWGMCVTQVPPSSCYTSSDCWTSSGSFDCYIEQDQHTETTWNPGGSAYGPLFLTVAFLFLFVNFAQTVTAIVWVSRTGAMPCCSSRRYTVVT